MLVLARHVGQRIIINGGEIVIDVLEIRGDSVRIGITAPREITVYREEIHKLRELQDSSLPRLIENPAKSSTDYIQCPTTTTKG